MKHAHFPCVSSKDRSTFVCNWVTPWHHCLTPKGLVFEAARMWVDLYLNYCVWDVRHKQSVSLQFTKYNFLLLHAGTSVASSFWNWEIGAFSFVYCFVRMTIFISMERTFMNFYVIIYWILFGTTYEKSLCFEASSRVRKWIHIQWQAMYSIQFAVVFPVLNEIRFFISKVNSRNGSDRTLFLKGWYHDLS